MRNDCGLRNADCGIGEVMGRRNAEVAPYAPALDLAREKARNAKAPNTRRAYVAGWNHFAGWCMANGRGALPASGETVAVYVSECDEDGTLMSTIEVRLAAISQAHGAAGFDSPRSEAVVGAVCAGIRRARGSSVSKRQKAAVSIESLGHFRIDSLGETVAGARGIRDRAIVLLGFAAGMRRSEIVGLNLEDLEWVPEGVVVTIRRSKTDWAGEGRQVAVAYGGELCPVAAVREWMSLLTPCASRLTPLFRRVYGGTGRIGEGRLTDQVVADVVQRWAGAAGLDPALYGGHSLRSGLVTAAARAGLPIYDIMNQTGHRSEKTVRGYIRRATLFENNVSGRIGL